MNDEKEKQTVKVGTPSTRALMVGLAPILYSIKDYNAPIFLPNYKSVPTYGSKEAKHYDSDDWRKNRHKYDKIGRNEPCPCGSGKKFKKCCWTGNTVIDLSVKRKSIKGDIK